MFELNEQTAAEYVRTKFPVSRPVSVRELAGGVSNTVLFVQPPYRDPPFVLKQARPRLRVADEWLCPVERIFVESDVLLILGRILADRPQGAGLKLEVPRLILSDTENYCYAMSAVDPSVPTWKDVLLRGQADCAAATAAGTLLGLIHARTLQDLIADLFADTQYFEALRIDPYYRHLQRSFPELHQPLQELIDSLAANRCCFVHGDFSPKNLLLSSDTLTLLDFEVGHYGDPAFDVGFFFTHLVLKWLWSGRKDDYRAVIEAAAEAYRNVLQPQVGHDWSALVERSRINLGGCILARIDGKSRVDYLSPEHQATAREWGRELLAGHVPAAMKNTYCWLFRLP